MGYRYSTSGFYTLSDTMYKHMDGYEFNDGDDEDTPMWSRYYNLFYTKRGKLQVISPAIRRVRFVLFKW